MAAKLYECRDTAKSFFKEEYKSKLQPYTHIVNEVMKANNLEEIPALLRISKLAKQHLIKKTEWHK